MGDNGGGGGEALCHSALYHLALETLSRPAPNPLAQGEVTLSLLLKIIIIIIIIIKGP